MLGTCPRCAIMQENWEKPECHCLCFSLCKRDEWKRKYDFGRQAACSKYRGAKRTEIGKAMVIKTSPHDGYWALKELFMWCIFKLVCNYGYKWFLCANFPFVLLSRKNSAFSLKWYLKNYKTNNCICHSFCYVFENLIVFAFASGVISSFSV